MPKADIYRDTPSSRQITQVNSTHFCDEEDIMGKGNNSQKNDKKNKKPKSTGKAKPSK